jgi:hypothetical protein
MTAPIPRETPAALVRRLFPRIVGFFIVVTLVAWALQKSVAIDEAKGRPAGFVRGALHGALMPMALPALIMGRDVPIFAEHHAGQPYKLGYVVGVDVCGAIFFGLLYRRVRRWKTMAEARNNPAAAANP